MRTRHRSLDLFARYVGPQWRQLAVLGLLVGASIALQLIAPQLLRAFIDGAIGGADLDVLVRIAILFVALALGQQIAAALATYLGESIGWVATNALRADLALHCLNLDLGFHKARTPGELIERIDGDVTALAGFFSRFIVNVLGNVVLLVGVLIVVAIEDWRAGLALTGFAVLAVGLLLGPLRTIAGRMKLQSGGTSTTLTSIERASASSETRMLTSLSLVAAIARKTPTRSTAPAYSRRSQEIEPSAAYS